MLQKKANDEKLIKYYEKLDKKERLMASYQRNKDIVAASEELRQQKFRDKVENTVAKLEDRKNYEYLRKIEKEEMRRLKAIDLNELKQQQKRIQDKKKLKVMEKKIVSDEIQNAQKGLSETIQQKIQ